MDKHQYQIHSADGKTVTINIKRDKRLRNTSRWERLNGGDILLRVPYRLPIHKIQALLEQVAGQLDKGMTLRSRRTDADLQQRAEMLNRKYLNGKIRWNAIRWVSNMHTRLGSCTQGGPTDGDIRISDKIRSWPGWVVDFVVVHELLHRNYPNHSQAFWDELRAAYPLTDKAIGFIEGVNYANGRPIDSDWWKPEPQE